MGGGLLSLSPTLLQFVGLSLRNPLMRNGNVEDRWIFLIPGGVLLITVGTKSMVKRSCDF